ncbi:hypothetical protein [Desulfosporosinus lacus]|uniref:Uncharacterized protein n=1 Tax=Desulfosporosinus lacus DSM 15449 TaxID=1121420 RepID=A0A1M5QCB1_9FIRM|nr:hypothetical protein [Desulfosporosinus lacus]SHH11501.1 hypothetical protein SAMN02746098_00206 [Desulfosporosinus lacus DSM 15449]
MVNRYMGYPGFKPGDKVVSLAIHPPEIQSGTKATIVSPKVEGLYAVQLPNGELHRWFAWSELEAVNSNPNCNGIHQKGVFVRILNDQGHPHMIHKGMIVKVVKVIPQTLFYDLRMENGMYHRWLADFELIPANLV